MTRKTLVCNSDGSMQIGKRRLGLTEIVHAALLNIQDRSQVHIVHRSLADLAPRTPQEQADLAWDDGLMDGHEQRCAPLPKPAYKRCAPATHKMER